MIESKNIKKQKDIRVGIVGGAGYTGGELIRLLVNHPRTVISFVHSKSSAGKKLSSIHADLFGDTDQEFTEKLSDDIDVLFLCVGHGEAHLPSRCHCDSARGMSRRHRSVRHHG